MTNLKTITISEAATLTGFSQSIIRRLVHNGEWASVRTGPRGQFRIFEDSIAAWFKQQTQAVSRPSAIDADDTLPKVSHPEFS